MQRKSLWFLCVAVSISAVSAQTDSKRTVTLEDCIQMALQHNLDVQIQRIGPEISRYDLSGAYGSYDPTVNFGLGLQSTTKQGQRDAQGNITLSTRSSSEFLGSQGSFLSGLLPTGTRYSVGFSYSHTLFDNTFEGVTGRTEQHAGDVSIQATQPLLKNFWIDSARQFIAISKQNLKGSELALLQQVMSTITLVEEAYYDVIFARENVKVQETALKLADRLLAENKKRVEVGALAPLDEKQAEAQAASSRADLLQAQRTVATTQNVLKNQLTDDYASWHGVDFDPAGKLAAIPTALQVQDSWMKGLVLRPDLEQLRVALARQDILLRYNKNQLYPSLDLIASYGRNAVDPSYGPMLDAIGSGDNPRRSVMLSFSMPLGNRAARNTYRANQAEKQQALLQLKKLEQSVMVEIDNAIALARTSFERVEATRQARVYSEAALDAEQKKLENGKSTSFEVLRLQRDLTSAASAEIRALADYNIALARLALSEGATLERHRIEWVVK